MAANPYSYTVEKLTNALECLATHKGDARERVVHALESCITLSEDDFPEEHRGKWRWVKREATKYGPVLNHRNVVLFGSIENTMRHVRNSTASKIAKGLYELYWAVSRNTQYS